MQEGLAAAAPGCVTHFKSGAHHQTFIRCTGMEDLAPKYCVSSCCNMMHAGAVVPRCHSMVTKPLNSPRMARGIVKASGALHCPCMGMNSKFGGLTAHRQGGSSAVESWLHRICTGPLQQCMVSPLCTFS